MRHFKIILTSLLFSFTLLNAGWLDVFTDSLNEAKDTYIEEITSPNTEVGDSDSSIVDLTSTDMNNALKEALNDGVDYAVQTLSAKDGYYKNPLTKIVLPESLQNTANLVRKLGGDKYVDDLILAFNNAATEAAPKTAGILAKSISNMSIDDAKNILSGSDNAATNYFRESSTQELHETIAPIIQKSMDNNSVAMHYKTLQSFYKENSDMLQNEYVSSAVSIFGYSEFMPNDKEENLNEYVTSRSIDGLMLMIEEKEKEIRANPLLQNSDLIKEVFTTFE